MSDAIRVLTFSTGVSTGAPLLSKIDSTGFKPFTSDAEYTTFKGGAGELAAGDAYFNTTTSLIRFYDGSAWEGVVFGPVAFVETIGAGGFITLTPGGGARINNVFVSSSGGAVTLSTTPFGTDARADGLHITLVGTSDTNTITIPHTDSAKGAVLVGECTLTKYSVITFVYSSVLDRFIEITRNF